VGLPGGQPLKSTGKIDGLFHVPGKLMRRLKDRSGYVLLDPSGEKNTDFYNFGEKVEYTEHGEPTSNAREGQVWNRNEVICFRLYTSESRDYGMPRDVALALEYAGDKLAAEYNVSFFDAGGTPPTVLFISSERRGSWAASSSVSRRRRSAAHREHHQVRHRAP
jgi:phage portal protein BeeE